jgi:hypothetical protein
VTIGVRRDGKWQPFVELDARIQSPTFGMSLVDAARQQSEDRTSQQ